MSTAPQQRQNQMSGAEVVRLGELVNYQEGAVVSRTLLKLPTGTITAFAFDAGQGLSEHTAAFDALAQILEGRAEITIAGKAFQVESGQAILLPANQPHGVAALSRFKMLLTMIRF
jgi:quercetin dioxygenase-like cupin family protein